MRWIGLGLAAFLIFNSPGQAIAQARITFGSYEGPDVVKVGTGGTKVTKHGIDYWTSGTPPRRYKIIGLIQDRRDEMWDGGNAIGSPKIAGKVKKAGGDGVILQSQDEVGKGGAYGSGMFGGLMISGSSKTVTVLVVIKYLPDEPAAETKTEKP